MLIVSRLFDINTIWSIKYDIDGHIFIIVTRDEYWPVLIGFRSFIEDRGRNLLG